MEIDAHIGCAMSGLTADARTMVEHARMTGQMHAFTYDEPIGVESVAQAVCDLALRFGESVDDDDAMMVSYLCSYLNVTSTNGNISLFPLVTAFWCCVADSWYRFTRACSVSSTSKRLSLKSNCFFARQISHRPVRYLCAI
jgi:hypothetical protein